MKRLYFLSLVCALFFKDAASRLTHLYAHMMKPYECEVAPGKTEGCNSEMRMFGPNYQYRCNCKHVSSCDFQNKGICKDYTCLRGFSGPYCQRIDYYKTERSPQPISLKNYLELWTNDTADSLFSRGFRSNDTCRMNFHQNFRINFIMTHCFREDNITVYIGPNKFCEQDCRYSIRCYGSAFRENAIILLTSHSKFIRTNGCMSLWFGIACDKQCHCADNAECDPLTGICPRGCEHGWSGHDCQEVNFENVALNKTANQSSTQSKGLIFKNGTCRMDEILFPANLAIDGNIDQQVERLSCMQTQKEKNPFWEVDLGKKYNISQIRIYNMNSMRTFYDGRISVFVDGEICNNNSFITPMASSVIDIMCTNVLSGTSVRIIHNGFASLHFCEVEVLQCLPGYCGYRCSFNCSECQTANCQPLTGQFYDNSNEMNHCKAESYIIPLVIGMSILIMVSVMVVSFCVVKKISRTKTDAKTKIKTKTAEMKAISVKELENMKVNDAENDENFYDSLSIDTADGVITDRYCTEESMYENPVSMGRGTNHSKLRMQMR